MSFNDLKLHPELLRAVRAQGYSEPTAIQKQAIPHVLSGRDVVACAQTGTGKTAAFALPILQRLMATPATRRDVRALVLVPTRELARQVCDSFGSYGRSTGLRATSIFGGTSQVAQERALRAGVDIVVASPGRLLDLLEQGLLSLRAVEVLVLDEADRMLDMGFIQPIRRIVSMLPKLRQNLMFSATMPQEVHGLATQLLNQPVKLATTPVASTTELVLQQVYLVEREAKVDLLLHILNDPDAGRVIVFTRTKHGADRLLRRLSRSRVRAAALHGNKSQNQRQRALASFREGAVRVLVATDVAARGIDVADVSHVVNFDVPRDPESYVHRIGRTGRAGQRGTAMSFCDREERKFLRDIERLTRRRLTVVGSHPFAGTAPAPTGHSMQPQALAAPRIASSSRRTRRPRAAHRRSPGAR